MKMKINLFRWGTLGIVIVSLSFTLFSCVDKIGDSEINMIQGSSDTVSTSQVALGMLKEGMMLMHDTREHKYQYQFNLHIDAYAGYLTVANNLEGRIPSTYFINPDFESGPLTSFLWVANQVVPVINSAEKLGRPDLGAIANMMFCFMTAECVDVYGPMPYFEYRQLKSDPPMTYNTVEEIYNDLFLQLRSINEILKNTEITSEERSQLSKMDLIGQGDFNIWRKFANTLRLRLAIRISKVAPGKAKEEAEAAIKDGVLESNDENITLYGYRFKNLQVISQQWGDTRLGASLQNILECLNHPYLTKYFDAHLISTDKNGKAVIMPEGRSDRMGIRPGTSVPSKSGVNPYASFSGLSSDIGNMPQCFMKVCEAYFLRAEGALRGWQMGDKNSPSTFYTTAIRMSFTKENLGDSNDMNNYYSHTYTPKPYIDLYDESNNYDDSQGLISIQTKWDEKASNEEKLERIITQKYVANFPLSLEAWSEFRRTGYPHLIPVSYDGGDFSIPEGGYIRRMIFQRTGSAEPADVERTGVPALNGLDEQATRLWWDVDTPNI